MHMIRYTVQPDHVAENERLLAAIFDELAQLRPSGLTYSALKLDDDKTFIHLIDHDAKSGHLLGSQLDSLRAFHMGLRDRCEDAPTRTAVTLLGSYRSGDNR